MAKRTKATATTTKVATPTGSNPLKVLYGYIVDHSKKDPVTKDNRVFVTNDSAVKGDIFAVFADDKLKFFKVSKVQEKYEYTKAGNGGVALSDLRYVIQKIDLNNYRIMKAFGAKMKGLLAALSERAEEARTKTQTTDLIKSLKGEQKMDVEALVSAIDALKADPASALNAD